MLAARQLDLCQFERERWREGGGGGGRGREGGREIERYNDSKIE